MNKCSCNKIQQPGEIWMQGLCNKCGSEMGACSWNCSLEICQNCWRDSLISEILDLEEMRVENIGILKNSEIL